VSDGTPRDIRLGDLAHRDRGLHPRLDAHLLQEVLEREAVHDDAEHAHVVGAHPIHAALLELGAPEEVAAAGHHGDLRAGAGDRCDLARDPLDDVGVDADLPSPEHLSGELQQDSLVAGHRAPPWVRWSG